MCNILFFTQTARPPSTTLFPYTTLFRSTGAKAALRAVRAAQRTRLEAARLYVQHRAGDRTPRHPLLCELRHYFDGRFRSEEHTSELQSHVNLVCRLLLEKKMNQKISDEV